MGSTLDYTASVNSVDEFVSRHFPGAKRRPNGQYLVKCPAHADKHPSLSIGQGEKGGIVLKCFAGCKAEDICDALHIDIAEIMPPGGRPEPVRIISFGKRTKTEYIYRDPTGEPLYKAIREDRGPKDKTFALNRWTGTSWAKDMGGLGRSLYRLPELLKADPGEPVYIVEGEKCVDALHEHGFYATTTGGAKTYGAWVDMAEHLRGRVCVILPDNDAEGYKYADETAAALQGVASRVSVLLLDGLGPKGDVYDWLQSGHEVDELEDLAAGAPAWIPGMLQAPTPTVEPEPETPTAPAKELKLRLVDMWTRDILRLGEPPLVPAEREYILELHDVPSLNLFVGKPGSKKSLFLADAAVCEAAGCLWLPKRGDNGSGPFFGDIRGTGKGVLWIDYDMGRQMTEERFYAFARAHGIANLNDIPLHILSISAPMSLDNLDHVEQLGELVLRLDARLVIIDTLLDVKGSAKEADDSMGAIFGNLRRVASECSCAIDLIHHPGKNESPDNPYRGSSTMGGRIDLGATIARRGMEFSQPLDVSFFKVRGAEPLPISALFQWETHETNRRVLWEASFVGVPTSAAAGNPAAIRATIRKVLREHPGIGKTDAETLVHSELKLQGVKRLDVRSELTRLQVDAVIQTKPEGHNKQGLYWPDEMD